MKRDPFFIWAFTGFFFTALLLAVVEAVVMSRLKGPRSSAQELPDWTERVAWWKGFKGCDSMALFA